MGAEADGATEVLDARDEVRDDVRQDVRPNMGLGVPKDVAWGTDFDERLEDQSMQGVFRPGIELAVGEGAGTAEAELNVAFGVENSGGVEVPDCLGASRGVIPAFEQDGTKARLGERERGEKACAARSDDDRAVLAQTVLHGSGEGGVVRIDRAHALAVAIGEAREQIGLVDFGCQVHEGAQREMDVRLLSGVDGFAPQFDAFDICTAAAEDAECLAGARLDARALITAIGQAAGNLGNLKHGAPRRGRMFRGDG